MRLSDALDVVVVVRHALDVVAVVRRVPDVMAAIWHAYGVFDARAHVPGVVDESFRTVKPVSPPLYRDKVPLDKSTLLG